MSCPMKENTIEQGIENIILWHRIVREDVFKEMTYAQSTKND